MSHTLNLLAELRSLLSEEPSETTSLKWWDRVLSIQADLESDPNSSDQEMQLVGQLRDAVSDLILAEKEGNELHPSRASVAITGLEGSIKRRTIGEDGYPLA